MLPLTVPTAESGEGCATCRSHPLPEGQAERPPVIRRPSMSLAVRRRSSSPRTYPVHGVHRGLPGYRAPELFARRRDGAPDRTLGLIVAPLPWSGSWRGPQPPRWTAPSAGSCDG